MATKSLSLPRASSSGATITGRGVSILSMQSAASLLGIIRCIIFFLLFQRTLAKGITAGSLK